MKSRARFGKPVPGTNCMSRNAAGVERSFYYPRAFCPEDLSQDFEWLRCSGKGTVYTFTITRQNQSSGFRNKVPYVMAYVELEEGVRMLTNIVDCDPESVTIGMPVEVTFEDVTPEVAVPLFKPTA